MHRFTAEFGMGSGGSILLLSPSNWVLQAVFQLLTEFGKISG